MQRTSSGSVCLDKHKKGWQLGIHHAQMGIRACPTTGRYSNEQGLGEGKCTGCLSFMYLHTYVHEVWKEHQNRDRRSVASEATFSFAEFTLLHKSIRRWSIIFYNIQNEEDTDYLDVQLGVNEEISELHAAGEEGLPDPSADFLPGSHTRGPDFG
jgi:hypothetical protein